MSTATAILALNKAVDADNAKTYLETNLGASLDVVDALFHSTTGHLHTASGTNGPAIGTTALAANAVTQTGLAAGATSGPTTTSATFVDMTDMSVTLTTVGGNLLVWFSGTFQNSLSAAIATLGLSLDGAAEVAGQLVPQVYTPGALVTSSMVYRFTGVAAGSHTVKARWATSTGTLTGYVAARYLLVLETKK